MRKQLKAGNPQACDNHEVSSWTSIGVRQPGVRGPWVCSRCLRTSSLTELATSDCRETVTTSWAAARAWQRMSVTARAPLGDALAVPQDKIREKDEAAAATITAAAARSAAC